MRAYNLQSALQKPALTTGLFLNRMELATIPPEALRLPNLKELDLSHNQLEALPSAVGRLTQLERLILSNNRIRILPPELGHLKLLREIRLDHNQLATWPEVLYHLPRLEKITLSYNRLENIAREVRPFPRLLDLSLAYNALKKLPDNIGRWQTLRALDLSGNHLKQLPAALGQCRELDHLNLGHNRLRQLPHGLDGLQKLRFLNIESNSFADLPEVVFSWPHLRHLAAAGNRIRQLPATIGRLQWLSHLDLGNNQLETISPAISSCNQLQTLLLEKNDLPDLPSFSSLQRLYRLDIRQNQVKELPPLPAGLKVLAVGRNALTDLPVALTRLANLVALDISYNKLTALPDNFDQLRKLEVLNLRRTALSPWPASLIQLDRLQKLKSDWPAAERKTFLKLLRACAKAKIPEENRPLFFRWITGGDDSIRDCSLSILFQAANLKHSELRRIARAELFRRRGSDPVTFDANRRLCILGKTAAPRKMLVDRLRQQNISVSTTPGEETTQVLLGNFPAWSPVLEKIKPIFLTEPQLINWLDEREGRYLRTSAGKEEVDRLRELLLHDEPVNVQLAIQIMQGGGVPASILTELLIAWKQAKTSKLRLQLKQLLWQYTPESARWVLEMPLSLSKNQPEALLRANIRHACEETPFDEQTILRHARL